MYGYIDWRETGKGGFSLQRTGICGVCFWELRVPKPGSLFFRRRLQHAVHTMRANGVRRTVFPPDFPFADVLAGEGITPLPEENLRRRLLEQLLERACGEEKISVSAAAAALYARGESRDVRDASRLLAEKCRYVQLHLARDSGALEKELRCTYGVCAAPAGQRPDIAVTFDSGPQEPLPIPVIRLGADCRGQPITYDLPAERLAWLGERAPTSQLVTALFEAGKLPLEEIHVKTLTFFA